MVATARSSITGTSFTPSVRSRWRYCGSSIETSSLLVRLEYRQTFEVLLERLTDKQLRKTMVEIPALAHERTCERLEQLARTLDAGEFPRYG